jgi:Tol biopolymer transport system component
MQEAFAVALSPDGTQVATEIQELPGWDDPDAPVPPGGGWLVNVYVVGADGSNLRLLAPDAASPTWAPDGSQIASITAENAVETIAPDALANVPCSHLTTPSGASTGTSNTSLSSRPTVAASCSGSTTPAAGRHGSRLLTSRPVP